MHHISRQKIEFHSVKSIKLTEKYWFNCKIIIVNKVL